MNREPLTVDHRCGYITILGRPNVGKSTLLNQLLGQKIAIVSEKPNTTRNQILGVKTLPSAQLVFLDTPGIHEPVKELNKYMVESALRSAEQADLLYLMIDASAPWREDDQLTLTHLKKLKRPMILVINKIDLVEKSALLPIIDQSRAEYRFEDIIPVSSLLADGLDQLLNITIPYLPQGPALFPEDMVTDQAERFWVAEIIREKIFLLTRQEVPYSAAVIVEDWTEDKDLLRIHATIYVEKDSQKGIVIGQKGTMIKKIGTSSRMEIEQSLKSKVFLELQVKVSENWTRNEDRIRRMGYR